MLSKIFSALTLVRHAVAITLVTGAATAMVAGSLDVAPDAHTTTNVTASTNATSTSTKNTTTSDLEAAVKACLATKDPQSLECHTALDMSGVSNEEFWTRLALSLSEQLARQTSTSSPKPEPTKKPETTEPTHPVVTGDLLYVVAACVESHERSSAGCQKALEMSGLSADEFYAKVAARFGKNTDPTTKSEPTAKPTEKTNTEGLSILIKDCLTKYETAKNTNDGGTAASEACKKAIEASGLSGNDFWARFGRRYHWVIVDAPPVLEGAESEILGSTVDTTVLIVQAARTKRGVVQRALERFAKAGAPVLGAVLNRRRLDIPEFIYRRV